MRNTFETALGNIGFATKICLSRYRTFFKDSKEIAEINGRVAIADFTTRRSTENGRHGTKRKPTRKENQPHHGTNFPTQNIQKSHRSVGRGRRLPTIRYNDALWSRKAIIFLCLIDASGEVVGDEISFVGRFLNKTVEYVGGVEALSAAIVPIRWYLGDAQTNQSKKKDQLAAIVLLQDTKTEGVRKFSQT
ncbi:uncharacterized protein LOC134191457 [Corticium candelabrum]|uniref:uncharacterized protein LOC134191457 n=1 Tax=Corticium candelabrum TaxID=121492 RepID=UPI002E257B24|nr:uncharacterized protein LOC134191457 [Corticium candelabrum]